MDTNIKNVKLIGYWKDVQLGRQFAPTLIHEVSLNEIR
jgi:hypothetical protein